MASVVPITINARGADGTHNKRTSGAGTSVIAGIVDREEHNAELDGTYWRGSPWQVGIAKQMVRDPHIRFAFNAVKAPAIGATWSFQPALEADPLAAEISDFCAWSFFERLPWRTYLPQIFGFYRDGFSVFELTEDTCRLPRNRFAQHPGGGVGVVFSGFHQIPASTVDRWWQKKDQPTQLEKLTQYIRGSDTEKPGHIDVLGRHLLRFTWDQEGANFEGEAPLRAVYGPWKLKLAFLILNAIRHERQEVGVADIGLPEGAEATNAEVIEQAENIAASLGSHEKGYIIRPAGFTAGWNQAAANTGAGIHSSITYQDQAIAHNSALAWMLLGQQGGQGSYALSSNQRLQYELEREMEVAFICDTLTEGSDGWSPVKRLVAMNYGEEAAETLCPRAIVTNMPTRPWDTILDDLVALKNANIIRPDAELEEFIRTQALKVPGYNDQAQTTEKSLPPGAQISGVIEFVSKAASGAISRESAAAAFEHIYGFDIAVVEGLLGPIDFKPAFVETNLQTPPSEQVETQTQAEPTPEAG